jgi:hypothetical protein
MMEVGAVIRILRHDAAELDRSSLQLRSTSAQQHLVAFIGCISGVQTGGVRCIPGFIFLG